MKLLYISFFLILSFLGFSQNNSIYLKNITSFHNDTTFHIIKSEMDKDGSFASVGFFHREIDVSMNGNPHMLSSNSGIRNGFVVRYDSTGNVKWARVLSAESDSGSVTLFDLAITKSGRVYMIGYFSDTANINPSDPTDLRYSAGLSDGFLLALDTAGETEWIQYTSSTTSTYFWTIAVDSAESVYAHSFIHEGFVTLDPDPHNRTLFRKTSSLDHFLLKLDREGEIQWIYHPDNIGTDTLPSYHSDVSLAVDPEGYVYTSGTFVGLFDLNPSPQDTFMTDVNPMSLVYMHNYLIKLSPNGTFEWGKMVANGRMQIDDFAFSSDGTPHTIGILQHGNYSDLINDMDTLLDGMQRPRSIILINRFDKNTGDITSMFPFVQEPIWTVPFTVNHSIKLDENDNIYTSGTLFVQTDFDPNKSSSQYVNASNSIFLSKIDTNGDYVFVKEIGTNANITYPRIHHASDSNIILSGVLRGTGDFDPSYNTHNLSSPSGTYTHFITEYTQCEGIIENQYVELCSGESHEFDGEQLSSSGHYYSVFPASGNYCDSVVFLEIERFPISAQVSVSDTTVDIDNPDTNSSYQWFRCDDSENLILLPGDTNPVLFPPEDGRYKVTVENTIGCVDTSSCVLFTTISTSDFNPQKDRIYPNPADHTLHVELSTEHSDLHAELINIQGQRLWAKSFRETQSFSIQTSNFPAGLYLLKLENSLGENETMKVLIHH